MCARVLPSNVARTHTWACSKSSGGFSFFSSPSLHADKLLARVGKLFVRIVLYFVRTSFRRGGFSFENESAGRENAADEARP